MKKLKIFTIVAIICTTNYSSALIRIYPIQGDKDFIYTSGYSQTGQELEIQILSCPSINHCKDSDMTCVNDEKHWQCDQIYQASVEEVCTNFKSKKQYNSTLKFIFWGVIAFIAPPIRILSTGVGGAIAKGATVANTTKKVIDFSNISCNSLGINQVNSATDPNSLLLQLETDDGKVEDLITLFTSTIIIQNEIPEDAMMPLQTKVISTPVRLSVPKSLIKNTDSLNTLSEVKFF